MAYKLSISYRRFSDEILQLVNLIETLADEPECLSRDTHIEGCFIRLVVGWEVFVEEYFLRCMCTAQTRSGTKIKPKSASSPNLNSAFKKVNKHRRDRDKDFADWLDANLIRQHAGDHFRKNSRVYKLCETPAQLYELKVIRNAIAHRSQSAIKKFEKYVKDQMGYLAVGNPTMASLLVQKRQNSNEFIFSILANHFLLLADRLTK